MDTHKTWTITWLGDSSTSCILTKTGKWLASLIIHCYCLLQVQGYAEQSLRWFSMTDDTEHCKSVLQLNVLSDKVKHLRKQQFWWEKKSIHHKVSQRKWQYVQTSVHALYTAYGLKSYRSHLKTIMPEQKYACYHSISLTKSLGLSSLYLQISWLSVGSSVMLMQVWPPSIPPSTITPPTPPGWQEIFSQLQFTVHSPLWCLYSLCVH